MTEIDIFTDERIIGQKDILKLFEKLYDLHSWRGVLDFIARNNLPLRYTQSGRPMFLKSELAMYEAKYQNAAQKNS